MPLLGLAAWVGALVAQSPGAMSAVTSTSGLAATTGAFGSAVALAAASPRRRRAAVTVAAMLVVACGVAAVSVSRASAVEDGPVATLAHQRARVTLTGRVAADAVVVPCTVPRHQNGHLWIGIVADGPQHVDLKALIKPLLSAGHPPTFV